MLVSGLIETIRIPAEIDLWKLFSDVSRNQIHKMALFLALLVEKECRSDDKDGWVSLHSRTVRSHIPGQNPRRDVIEPLIAKGVVEPDESYSAGRFPKKYRLATRSSSFREWQLGSKPLVNAVARWRESEERNSLPNDVPIYRLLYDDLFSLHIDTTLAQAEVDRLSNARSRRIASLGILKISRQEHWASVDPFGRRFHSTLTRLKRELRASLSVAGEPLCEIDVRNCQPLLLSAYIGTDGGPDLAEYRELVESGELYDDLARELSWTRDGAKDHMGKYLLFDRRIDCNGQFRQHFQLRFPAVFDRLVALKRGEGLSLEDKAFLCANRKGIHRAVAMTLQRMESDVMIRGVASCLKERFPEVFVGTIHDAILCPPKLADTVRSLIESQFQDLYGVTPSVKEPEETEDRNSCGIK